MAGTDVKPRRIEVATYAVEDSLRDGATIQVRALRPGDKGRLLEHFAGLSAESRYLRFFGHKRELTNEDLVRFTELDFDRHVGIAATFCKDGHERFVGVGRYIRKDAPGRAEIALAVLDQYQCEGIGPLLLRHLARIANENGISQFEADVRGDNSRMLTVLAKSGCIIHHANSAGAVHFTLSFPEHFAPASNYDFNHEGRRSDTAMEAREFSASQNTAAVIPFPSIFPGHDWPAAVRRPVTVPLDESRFDQRSLLRRADDGGCAVGEGSYDVREVRTCAKSTTGRPYALQRARCCH